ncbi:MAG: glycosyltransferase family 2 protein [Anaerolineae bacterium]|nr:glycosyltransferase family 2 protein [Anaerolineae bacterium]
MSTLLITSTTEIARSVFQPLSYSAFHAYRYYLAGIAITVIGVIYGIFFSEIFFPGTAAAWAETMMGIFKLVWLAPLPYALVNFYAFMRYPFYIRPTVQSVPQHLTTRLYVRIVTRGHNPNLVAGTVESACRALSAALPLAKWRVEVVSDNPFELDDHNGQVHLIVVPPDYQPASGAKYKARALHYALTASNAAPEDWIMHLDEETRFDADTVRAIQRFIYQQRRKVMLRQQNLPAIGQGIITYGQGQIVNWFTTLADSIRVADDYGRFRLQYENGKAWFGMHGSFIVINNAIEASIGFDHGVAASITEDSYFALVAQTRGVPFAFINARMYEKSPFSVMDFIKQRRRWFGGIWFCVKTPDLPIKERFILGLFMWMWSVSWLCPVMVLVNFLYPTATPPWLGILSGIAFMYTISMYIIGFHCTFRREDLGSRYVPLLMAQIIGVPLFSFLEGAAVLYGLLAPPKDFYIVKKEA